MVWVVRSNDEHRHLEVRLCAKCMTELRKQTHNVPLSVKTHIGQNNKHIGQNNKKDGEA
jgi:hypothetical protein